MFRESMAPQIATMQQEAKTFELSKFGDYEMPPELVAKLDRCCGSKRVREVKADRIDHTSMQYRDGHTNSGTSNGGRNELDEYVETYGLKDNIEFRVDKKRKLGQVVKYQYTETCSNKVMPFISTCGHCFIPRQKVLIDTKMSNIAQSDRHAENNIPGKYNGDDYNRVATRKDHTNAGRKIFHGYVGKLSLQVSEASKDGSTHGAMETRFQSLFPSGRADTKTDAMNPVMHESVTVGR